MKRREFLTRSGAAVAGGVAFGALGGVTAACGSSEKAEKEIGSVDVPGVLKMLYCYPFILLFFPVFLKIALEK